MSDNSICLDYNSTLIPFFVCIDFSRGPTIKYKDRSNDSTIERDSGVSSSIERDYGVSSRIERGCGVSSCIEKDMASASGVDVTTFLPKSQMATQLPAHMPAFMHAISI